MLNDLPLTTCMNLQLRELTTRPSSIKECVHVYMRLSGLRSIPNCSRRSHLVQSRKPFAGGQRSQPCDHFCTPIKLSARELEGVDKREFANAVLQNLAGFSGCFYRREAESFAGS
jgi:hypothetical protein